jgi:hypothetical protein
MYKKSSTGWLKHLDFMVLDIICLQLAFVMGYFLRHHSFKPYGSPIYRNEAIVFALIQLMIMFFDDSFKKIVITKDIVPPYYDDYGILTVNIYDFLLDPQILEK